MNSSSQVNPKEHNSHTRQGPENRNTEMLEVETDTYPEIQLNMTAWACTSKKTSSA